MAKPPNLDRFLSDPAFADDRELFEGFFNHLWAKREEEAKRKAEDTKKKRGESSVFDKLFGGNDTDEG